MKSRKVMAGLLALAFVFGGTALPAAVSSFDTAVTASAATTAKSGTCGKNLTWSLDDGTLTISGTGKMTDYAKASNPWYKNSSINNIIIGDGVTSIGNYAFDSCTGFKSITIADSVTSIGVYAFNNCANLRSVTIPNNVTSIDLYAFYSCSKLESVIIPDSVTSIGAGAFGKCSSLTSITIPDGVTSIGYHTFYSCTKLTSITIPKSVTDIGDWAFLFTPWLKNQSIKDPLVIVNNILVDGSSANGIITIPDGVTKICASAFSNCTELKSITIPNSVTSIESSTFSNCSRLTSINIPDSVTSIGNYAFESCSSLTSIAIPNSVTSIGDYAFDSCTGIKSITIPKSVTSIGMHAFGYNVDLAWNETVIDGFTINGCKGTAAETYANGNGIPFFDINSYPSVKSEVRGDRFRLKWDLVPNAEKYGLAIYQAGKWRTKAIYDGNVTTCTSPKMNKGTYKMIVCAKINGEWDTSNFNKRIIKVTVK